MARVKITSSLLLILIIFLVSCKKEYSAIGLDMADDLIGATMDTTSVTTHSVIYDSLITSNLANQLIGENHDPIFGTTAATVYAQFLLSGSNPQFGSNPVLDSVVLTLHTAFAYGDTMAPLRFEVYELSEDLAAGTIYYASNTTEHNGENLVQNSNVSYFVKPGSSVIINGDELSPHIRVRLKNEFGQRFIDEAGSWYTDDDVKDAFRGLSITATSNHANGCIFSSSMVSSMTGLVIYYHNDLDDGLNYTFTPSDNGVIYNNFNHFNYADAAQDLRRQIIGQDQSNAQTLYLQAMGGVKAKIRFPYISQKFASLNKHVVINRAELVISNCFPNELIFTRPANLTVQGVKKDGTLTYIPDDESVNPSGFFGGTYDVEKAEYRIRITNYIQNLVLDKGDYADYLYLIVKGSGIRGNRLVFYGSNPNAGFEGKQLRLEIAYTPY